MSSVATLSVAMIANTMTDFEALEEVTGGAFYPTGGHSVDDADVLAEFAGRACYQSWERPNPKTADTVDYLDHILELGHLSVVEHGTVSFYIEGVSRSLTHELVRHRHFSFSQLSQRYVDEADARYVVPPALRGDDRQETRLAMVWDYIQQNYTQLVADLTAQGLPRKEARQTARSVLPNMTETKLVVSGNHRSWREFLILRGSAAADTEIRELAVVIFHLLADLAPGIYQDIEAVSLKDGSIGLQVKS